MSAAEATPAEAARFDLEGIGRALAVARTTVASGQAVDLAGLESRVDKVCVIIRALPAAERKPFEPALLALIDELNGLTEALSAQRAKIHAELDGSSTHRAATSAYRKSQR